MWEPAVPDGHALAKKESRLPNGRRQKNGVITVRLRGALPRAPSLVDQIS